MSERPDPGSGDVAGAGSDAAPESLLEAVEVRRNARVGLAAGVGFAGLLYLRTFLATGASRRGGFYLGLALVLAATLAGVVTAALCLKTFLQPVLDGAAWLRRGGTAAALGGAAAVALPVVAWLARTGPLATGHWRLATALAALAIAAGAAGLHVAVRSSAGPVERVAAWLVVLGWLLAAGNATGDAAPVAAAGPLPTPFLASVVLACAAAVPLGATAERSGRLRHRSGASLLAGGLLAVGGAAWLLLAGGWEWLSAATPVALPGALAVVTVPAGLGWIVAGAALRAYGVRHSGADSAAGSPPERATSDHIDG